MKTKIKTKRLLLIKPSLSDLEELYELTSKEEVNLFNPKGADKHIDEARLTLQSFIEDWRIYDIGIYIVRLASTYEFVGYIGLYLKRQFGIKVFNLSYRIEPKFQRKGYVLEACEIILSEIKKEYKDVPVMVLTKRNNIPSINLAKKLGFIYNEKFDSYIDSEDVFLFDVDKSISSAWI